jgi:hypothetical protein
MISNDYFFIEIQNNLNDYYKKKKKKKKNNGDKIKIIFIVLKRKWQKYELLLSAIFAS